MTLVSMETKEPRVYKVGRRTYVFNYSVYSNLCVNSFYTKTFHLSPAPVLPSAPSSPGRPGRKGFPGLTLPMPPVSLTQPPGDLGFPGESGPSGGPGENGQPGVPGRSGERRTRPVFSYDLCHVAA